MLAYLLAWQQTTSQDACQTFCSSVRRSQLGRQQTCFALHWRTVDLLTEFLMALSGYAAVPLFCNGASTSRCCFCAALYGLMMHEVLKGQ